MASTHFDQLVERIPATLGELGAEFTTHEFTQMLMKHNQRLYIRALLGTSSDSPFQELLETLAQTLAGLGLVQQIGIVTAPDMLGETQKVARWQKTTEIARTYRYPAIRQRMIEAAKTEDEFVWYKEVIQMANLRVVGEALGGALGEVLYQICQDDWQDDPTRPMLSAVAMPTNGSRPGNGFFELARQAGRLDSTNPYHEDKFWIDELKALRAYWQGQ